MRAAGTAGGHDWDVKEQTGLFIPDAFDNFINTNQDKEPSKQPAQKVIRQPHCQPCAAGGTNDAASADNGGGFQVNIFVADMDDE